MVAPTLPFDSFTNRFFDSSKHPHEGKGPKGGQFSKTGGKDTTGGGKPAAEKPAAVAKPEGSEEPATQGLVSLNVANITFDEAVKAVDSTAQSELVQVSRFIDDALGIKGNPHDVIGAWADGAENSVMISAPGASVAEMRLSLAMKAHLADQKSALMFKPGEGDQIMFTFAMDGELSKIHDQLLQEGIAFHTLEPTDGGAVVHVFASDQDTVDAVGKAAKKFNADLEHETGRGEFIGTTKTDGTDREQRDDARQVYEGIIQEAAASDKFKGRDVEKVWGDARDHWQSLSAPAGIDVAATEQKAQAGVAAASKVSTQTPMAGSKATHPATVASAQPWSKGASVNEYQQPSVEALKLDPENFEHDVDLFKDAANYPNFREDELSGTADESAHTIVEHLKSNIRFFYNHAKDTAESKLWYDGARVIVDDRVSQYQYNDASVAAVYALFSPQKDWDQNVYLGDTFLHIYHDKQNEPWDEQMTAVAPGLWDKDVKKKKLGKWEKIAKEIAAEGKTLAEQDTNIKKAIWLRTYDEAHGSRLHRAVKPDGSFGEYKHTKGGKLSPAAWQSNSIVANAIAAIEANGDRQKISDLLGRRHKVRSFYNNILDPHSKNGDVTIDTHAVGVALMRPLGGSSVQVAHNFSDYIPGGEASSESSVTGMVGTYPFYADAYREVAKEIGLEPRQLQSIVWVAKRELFGSGLGGNRITDKQKNDIDAAWTDYHDNPKIELAAVQNKIYGIMTHAK